MPFFLIIIGGLLVFLNYKAIKKDENSFSSAVKQKEADITDFDIAIGEVRREFSETIIELQKNIHELKESLSNFENLREQENEQVEHEKMENNNINTNEIGQLIKDGVPLEDICEKYNIGKGEVLLIKELYLK